MIGNTVLDSSRSYTTALQIVSDAVEVWGRDNIHIVQEQR